MKLLHDCILAKRIKAKETNENGLFIPEHLQNKWDAKVIDVGPKVSDVKIGDTVRCYAGKGEPVKHNGEDLIIIREGINSRHQDIEFVL